MVIHVLLIVAILEAFIMPSRAFVQLSIYDPSLRLAGVFPTIHPDFLGLLACAAILLLIAGVGPPWSQSTGIKVALIGLYVGVLLLTRTRTALVLLLAGFLTLWLVSGKRRPALSFTLFAGILAGAIAFTLAGDQIVSFLSRQQDNYGITTLTGRTETWANALQEWSTSPVLGLGYYSGHRFDLGEVPDLDNMWLETLVDVGIVGVAIMAGFMLASAHHIFRRGPASPSREMDARRALFVVFVASSFVNPSLQTVTYSLFVLGMVVLGTDRPSRESCALARHSAERAVRGSGRSNWSGLLGD